MPRKTLLLFDSTTVREDAITYSIELAKRTESEVVLLLLLDRGEDGEEAAPRASGGVARPVLAGALTRFERHGIAARSELRVGDKASEFLKFLAQNGEFAVIVWGGSAESVVTGKGHRQKPHWVSRIINLLDCPLVVAHKHDP